MFWRETGSTNCMKMQLADRDAERCCPAPRRLASACARIFPIVCFGMALWASEIAAPGQDAPPAQAEPDNQRAPLQVEPPPARPPIIVPPGPFRMPGQADDDAPNRAPLAIDRQTLRQLQAATELIEKKQYSDAVRQLQRVLDDPEDSWIERPGGRNSHFQSAKEQAADRIGRLPRSVRESYETEYGQVARRMLEDATARNDRAALDEVVRRFFHTEAGYEAAYLLGNRLLDDSKLLAAEAHFDRLRTSPGGRRFEPMLSLKTAYCCVQSGLTENALQILRALQPGAGGNSIKIGGRSVAIPAGETKDLQWLAEVIGKARPAPPSPATDWPMVGGDPSRNAEGASALPLGEPIWTHSVIRDPNFFGKNRFDHVESVLQAFEHELGDRGGLTLPVTEPLVVGNTAVFRTLARLRAVDMRTGERLWDFLECDRLYAVLATAEHQSRVGNRLPVNLEVNEPGADLRLFLSARSFRDRSYGALSSDGQRVFVLLDMGFLGQEEFRTAPQNEALGARDQNILAAVDLRTGEIQWEIGGARADRKNRDHAGTFFLGSGLPLDSALYCLGELDGEISLFKIDPATGKTAWTQRLVVPLGRLPHFPLRRLAGDNPSYASGLIVCPTSAGVVAAVDPSSRTLRWEYRYRINVAEDLPDPRMLWADEPLYTGIDESNRWLDSAPTIAEESVLLTPRDSNELHCLNLADGKARWKRERGNRLFIAGVRDGAVFVVGRSSIEALRLSDGDPVWQQPIEISMPAGRGIRNGSLYHLPLSTGELATINLRRGRVITRSRFPSSMKLGNLVAADGAVVMQSPSTVLGFRPTADLEHSLVAALERQPNDPLALATRGELRLDRGQSVGGLDDLFHSLRLRPGRRTEDLAVATVLESLRYDFSRSRSDAPRIEPLIADPSQRFEFHRLMARGLEQADDFAGALDHDLRLVDDDTLAKTLVSSGESTRVQPAAIVAADLGEMYRKAPAAAQVGLRKKIEEWAAGLAAAGKTDRFTRAAASLRELPEDVGLRRKLIEILPPDTHRAEIVRQLTHLRTSGDAAAAGYATARLARLMIDQGRAEEALPLLKELEQKFAGVTCSQGKSGADLALSWQQESSVKIARARLTAWPAGILTVKRREEDRATRAVFPVPIDQRSGTFFQQWRFESHAHGGGRGPTLLAFDDTGTERWQFELETAVPRTGQLNVAATLDPPVNIRVHGPLLEVAMHRRFAILDGFDGHAAPNFLWAGALYDPAWTLAQSRSEFGLAGLMTDDFVFSQLGSLLRCADVVTGNPIWERHNVATSVVLQGDKDYLVALARSDPNDPSGLVLHTATGGEVFSGLFGIPGPLQNQWNGRRVLVTSNGPAYLSLSLMDMVQRTKPAWNHSYRMPAWSTPIDDEEFAVLDSRGMLQIHSLESGARIVEASLERAASPSQILVRRVGQHYLAISQGGAVRFPGFRDLPHGLPSGKIWSIDRKSGKTEWTISMPVPQVLVETPADSPVLVFLRPPTRFESGRSNGEEVLSIIDARSGALIYDTTETTPPDRINVRLDRDARRVIVTTDKCVLTVAPSDGRPPASSNSAAPVEAPRPAAKP
jgi:outer membrane protein assembly factor BamB/predicted negative regulator of RcsB-dependent stress response